MDFEGGRLEMIGIRLNGDNRQIVGLNVGRCAKHIQILNLEL
ncbi:MAG: hypothetical protein CM1200mP10_23540 [Candidatus Neomarinimicrobiota bacterium]|nr:MAG: hypothetical protein CM1200mP10_23540 [Candidatus Neomarinimicrobiota bacterium]